MSGKIDQTRQRNALLWCGFVAYGLTITVLSLIPVALQQDDSNIDKLYHLVAYAGFAVLLFTLCQQRRARITGLVLLSLYGIAIEGLQTLTGREASSADVLANIAGLGIGALLSPLLSQPILDVQHWIVQRMQALAR